MIIKKEGSTADLIKNIETILNTQDYKKISTKEKINMLFLKYTLLKLNIDEINYELLNENSKALGVYLKDKNQISVNPSEIRNKSLIGSLTTIAHELRHCYQNNQNKPFKEFNVCKKSAYPIELFDSYLNYILDVKKIELYKYYYSSRLEKDARDYSLKSVKFFFNVIYCDCKKGTFANKLAKKELKRISKLEKIEERKYNKAYNHVEKTYKQLSNIVKYQIFNLININLYNASEKKNNDLNKYVKKHLESFLYVYCNDEITEKILNYCFQVNDLDTLFMCLNHPYTKISKMQFEKCLSFIFKNTDFTEKDVASSLVNWNMEFLRNYFSKNVTTSDTNLTLDEIFENSKKFVKKKKISNCRIFQIFKNKNLIIKNNKIKSINYEK